MLQLTGATDQSEDLHRLKQVQTSIYALDQYLESTWQIDHSHINQLWNGILTSLKNFDINFPDATIWCDEINRYLHHELELRVKKSPLRFTMRYYYYYKSCDIKLLRKLIYYMYPSLKTHLAESDWLQFDLITEIYDDLDDLFEDCNTYNANYFLFGVKFIGSDKIYEKFDEFLGVMEREVMLMKKEQLSHHMDEIIIKCLSHLELTRAYLSKQIEGDFEERINKALIFTEFLKN